MPVKKRKTEHEESPPFNTSEARDGPSGENSATGTAASESIGDLQGPFMFGVTWEVVEAAYNLVLLANSSRDAPLMPIMSFLDAVVSFKGPTTQPTNELVVAEELPLASRAVHAMDASAPVHQDINEVKGDDISNKKFKFSNPNEDKEQVPVAEMVPSSPRSPQLE